MGVTSEIKEYLRSDVFREELLPQYRNFEILSEGGLRTAVANLLRAKLKTLSSPAEDYRVTCETRVRFPNGFRIPDVLVWKGEHPRIWVELKDTRKFSQKNAEADWAKLKKCLEHVPSIMGGFLIYIARHDSTVPGIKRDRQTMRLWPIWIALQKDIPDFEQWNAQYRERTRYHPKKDRLGAR